MNNTQSNMQTAYPGPGPIYQMALSPQQYEYAMSQGPIAVTALTHQHPVQAQQAPGPPPQISNSPMVYMTSGYFPELEMEAKALMQTNGRKVMGPPEDWVGPPPTSAAELFVRRIPKEIDEQVLIQQFTRIGKIYEIRLPIDFNQACRGYCYVKYTNENDACCAMELLSHYFVAPKKKLEILHSYEKCRLFVGNIPRNITEQEVEHKMRCVFPNMERLFVPGTTNPSSASSSSVSSNSLMQKYNRGDGVCSRGCAIIQFPTHIQALEAKKCITPGLFRMWGRDLKVVWANDERENPNIASQFGDNETKTLFLRNVDFTLNRGDIHEELIKHVSRSDISKISKSRSLSFVEFTNREAAEKCLKKMQGLVLCGRKVDVEWAKPADDQSLHRWRNFDFDSVLRLKCLANNWQIPIIIFGACYEAHSLQYCAVMLRNDVGITRAVFCVLYTQDLIDIHARLCELVCLFIETIGVFPDYNYVFFVDKHDAHLLGMVAHNAQKVEFTAATQTPKYLVIDLAEIVDLSWSVAILSSYNEQFLLQQYQNSFQTDGPKTFLEQIPILGYRIFGTIHPNYRNKPPLKYNLNNSQIILSLCYTSSRSNLELPARPYMPYSVSLYDNGCEGFQYLALKMVPLAIAQARHGVDHILSCVNFENLNFYHPVQYSMGNSTYVPACSYAISLRNLPANIVIPTCCYYPANYVPEYNAAPNADYSGYNIVYGQPIPMQQGQTQMVPYQPVEYAASQQDPMLVQPQLFQYTTKPIEMTGEQQNQTFLVDGFANLQLQDQQSQYNRFEQKQPFPQYDQQQQQQQIQYPEENNGYPKLVGMEFSNQ